MAERNRAEKAGRVAKASLKRRKDRERTVGWVAAAFLGLPLLFAAVWCRMEVTEELRRRDDLLARRDAVTHARLKLTGEKSRLSTWEHLERRATALGLHEPSSSQVVWVAIEHAEDRR
jgi:hypothetical protein